MITLLIAVALVLILILSWVILLKDKNSYNIPGPTPLPLVGNGHLFVTRRTQFLPLLNGFQRDYGDAVRVHLFHNPYVLLYHPKYIEPIISSTELITKGKSYTFLHDWLGFGLLTSTGHKWRAHRKFLTPAFHFNILQNFLPVFIKNEKILINKLRNSYCNEKSFDLFPIIALTALDNITESIMGVSFNTQENCHSNYVKSIETLSQIISLKMRNPFVAEEAFFRLTPYKKSYDDAIKILHGHTKKVLAIRKEELKQANIESLPENTEIGIRNKHAFIDLLLLSKIDGKRIDEEAVREEVDTFMFEGHDTTTSGITFALFCLSKYQDIQEKVLQEQREIYDDDLSKDPIYSDLQKMKYLETVIKESLRLYPSVPLIERMITKDSELAGLKIKKNTSVIMDIFHMQRHPDLYDNPLEFRPERFDSPANAARNPFAWLAFSAGPRNCIGQKFAMMEMKVVIAAVIKSFKILPTDVEPALCSDLILRSKNGVKIKLIPRIK
ncbi:cytochrome P450 4d2-like [Pieris brassicae]|uniref:cytochrome P450 4d2-like n=1 Tax=Pieris brassicae TaxID=7116 RepID=UPI001E65FDD6|nr:cytochrome P450 4d2-like [Pieris brassicae]